MPNPERSGRQQMAGALASSLALHALILVLPFWWFLHQGSNAAAGRLGESGGGRGFTAAFLAGALQGSDVLVVPPGVAEVAEVAEVAPDLTEAVVVEPEIVSQETVPEITSETTLGSESAVVQGGSTGSATGSSGSGEGEGPGTPGDGTDPNGTGSGQGGTGDDPVAAPGPPGEVAMTPRVWVHPSIPYEIVRKRKINDYVLFQVLVDTDGSVKDVRILRTIADCDECTQNTIEAARRLHYNPVLVGGRAVEVWTVPISYRFSNSK